MSFTDRKIEISILGLSALMVVGLGYLVKEPVKTAVAEVQELIYEMPRPKNSFLAALFDLGDREVSRKYVNPFAKKKEEAKKTAEAKKPAAPVAPKAVAQKKNETKKSEDPNKKNVEVQIVGEDPGTTLTDDGFMGDGGPSQKPFSDVAGNGSEKTPQQQPDKNALSGTQWKALMRAQPTKENLTKLLQAYDSKEVDDQTFYEIVTDLFSSNKGETQALGLVAVKSVYSAKSFAVTAQYYDQLPTDMQQQAQTYLMSYAVTARLPMLVSALQSSNAVVVETAAQVVIEGHTKAKDGVSTPADPRNSRGDVTTNAIAGYSKFIPVFQQLAQSSDPAIKNLANTALSQIQTTVAAL
ncbi:hypothetical protein [Bdellovibrio sp. HCB-110]|uniref:hypothetical protein n=1 Tax=Bdellovibrio sp. HCB-110 TaxID=3391182 RepID=UPI0039B47C9A